MKVCKAVHAVGRLGRWALQRHLEDQTSSSWKNCGSVSLVIEVRWGGHPKWMSCMRDQWSDRSQQRSAAHRQLSHEYLQPHPSLGFDTYSLLCTVCCCQDVHWFKQQALLHLRNHSTFSRMFSGSNLSWHVCTINGIECHAAGLIWLLLVGGV